MHHRVHNNNISQFLFSIYDVPIYFDRIGTSGTWENFCKNIYIIYLLDKKIHLAKYKSVQKMSLNTFKNQFDI